LQPREQKGACSGTGGFRQIGQDFELGWLGIGTRHGQRSDRSQGDTPANLFRKRSEPVSPAFENRDDRGMGREADSPSAFLRSLSQQRTRFKRCAIGRKFEQVRTRTRAHDLKKAEAVDAGALERLRKDCIDRGADLLPLLLSRHGRQIDPDRTSDAMPQDRAGGRARSGQGQFEWRQSPVDVDQRHRRSERNAELAIGEADNTATSLIQDVEPASITERILRGWKANGLTHQTRRLSSHPVCDPGQGSLPRLGTGEPLTRHLNR